MASGDITSPTISSNGTEITFTVDSLTGASVTTIVDDQIGTLDCTDEIEGTTSTGSRTGIRVFYRSAAGSVVTGYLEEPIHDDTTATTLDMDAGAVTDGTVSSNAVSGDSVTNNSTLDYPEAVCLMASPRIRYTADEGFYVDVVAGGRVYNGHEGELGLDRVEVTVSDNWGGIQVGVTKSASTLTAVDREGVNGANSKEVVFRVGPFDPTAGGDWGGSAATTGIASVVARAYPKIGDADSVTTDPYTHYIYLDPAGAYEFRHAVVDPTSGDDATGRVATGDGGYYAGTDSVDATAAANPYATIHEAISEMQRGDGTTAAPSHNTASWCVVYLVEDSHTLGTYSFGDRSDTSRGPVILTRLPTATKANVKLTGSANSDGLRTNIVRFDDIQFEPGTTGDYRSNAPALTNTGFSGAENWYQMWSVDYVGAGRTAAAASNTYPNIEYIEQWDCNFSASQGKLFGERHRSCTVSDCSNDINTAGSGLNPILQFNILTDDLNADGTASHLDVLQFLAAYDHSDIVQWQGIHRNMFKVQSPFFVNGSGATPTTLTRYLHFGIISEDDNNSTLSQLDDMPLSSCYFYASSWFDGFSLSDDDLETTCTNVLFRGMFHNSITESFGIDVDITGSYWIDCYQSTLGTLGKDGIRIGGGLGDPASTVFDDTDTSYQPAFGEALDGAIATPFVSLYANGLPVAATQSIGAVNPASSASSLPPALFSVTNGTGGFELVTGATLDGSAITVAFSGDTPAAGDTGWTIDLNNAAGTITTTSNGAPIASLTNEPVTILSPSSGGGSTARKFVSFFQKRRRRR